MKMMEMVWNVKEIIVAILASMFLADKVLDEMNRIELEALKDEGETY